MFGNHHSQAVAALVLGILASNTVAQANPPNLVFDCANMPGKQFVPTYHYEEDLVLT